MTKLFKNTGTSPVTWKSGTLNSVRGCGGGLFSLVSIALRTIRPVA